MDAQELSRLTRAGGIAVETIAFARKFIVKGMPLLDIAERIEEHIVQQGGKPAFPVNLSINEIAAHATPAPGEKTLAQGLLKVDIGVQIEGCIADTAFTLDLEHLPENAQLIVAAEQALKAAVQFVEQKRTPAIREIGRIIANTITQHHAQPVMNLSGHSIEPYEIHAGVTLPNYDNAQEKVLGVGVYAIEPFATESTGVGQVRDGKLSGIYALVKEGTVRDTFTREVLAYIEEEYRTLPFCVRWLQKKFGSRVLLSLQRLETAGLVHQYPQLVEVAGKKVAQAEHTFIISEKGVQVTTR